MRRLSVLWALLWAAASAAAGPVELTLPGQPVKPAAEVRLILPGTSPQALNAGFCPLAASALPGPLQTPRPSVSLIENLPAQGSLARLQAAGRDLPKAPDQAVGALYGDRPSDGVAVSPHVALPGDSVAADHSAMVSAVRGTVDAVLPALKTSVARGDWNGPGTTLNTPCCGDAAPKLAYLLRKRGFPAHVVEAEFHFYVLVDLPGGRVVVDPTVRQFFGGPKAPEDVPAVFVGSYDELYALFTRKASARSSRFPFARIYFSEAKTADARVGALASEISAEPRRPDLAPLSGGAAN